VGVDYPLSSAASKMGKRLGLNTPKNLEELQTLEVLLMKNAGYSRLGDRRAMAVASLTEYLRSRTSVPFTIYAQGAESRTLTTVTREHVHKSILFKMPAADIAEAKERHQDKGEDYFVKNYLIKDSSVCIIQVSHVCDQISNRELSAERAMRKMLYTRVMPRIAGAQPIPYGIFKKADRFKG